MPGHTFPKPIIKPSDLSGFDKDSIVLDSIYFSGPEVKNHLIVNYEEYMLIIDRIIGNKYLMNSIIDTWRSYAILLRDRGIDVDPPIGDYQGSFMRACDPDNADRAAIIASNFHEKIESDVLLRYIRANNPSWSSELSVI